MLLFRIITFALFVLQSSGSNTLVLILPSVQSIPCPCEQIDVWAPSLPAQKRWLGFCESRLRGLVHAIDNASYHHPDDVRAHPYAEIFPWTRPASNGEPHGLLPCGQGTSAAATGEENGSTRSHLGQAATGPPSDNATRGAGQAAAPVEHVSSFFLALSFAAGLSHFDLTPCTREWVEKVNFWGGRTPGEEKERKDEIMNMA